MKLKKHSALIILICTTFFSCNKIDELTEFDVTENFSTSILVSANNESSEPQTFSETTGLNIASRQDISDNLDLIERIKINSITYDITNFEGPENATITGASLNFEGINIPIENIDVQQADINGTIFTISDANQLNAIGDFLKNSSAILITLTGTINGSPFNFDLNINMELTATIDAL